jgi:hypothetical protein
MKTKVNGVASPARVLVSRGAERSEAERSETERSAVPGDTNTLPDSEVLAKAQRRQFSADYKKRVLAEADAATESGAIGDLQDCSALDQAWTDGRTHKPAGPDDHR